MTFGNTSNRRRVCLFYQNEKTILVMQNVQLEFRQVLRRILLTVWTWSVAAASMEVTLITSTIICRYCL